MSFKLYTYPNNYRAFKALIAAEYNGIKIELPECKFGVTNKSDDYKTRLNPLGKVPALETPDGQGIFESAAIARYIARLRPDTGLYGGNFVESGQIDSWVDFATTELEPARASWLYPIFGYIPYHPKVHTAAKAEIAGYLGLLNGHLLNNTYLVGNQVTLADIVVASALLDIFNTVATPDYLKPFGNVLRWFNTLAAQPQFKNVWGNFQYATTEKLAPAAAGAPGGPAPAAAAASTSTPAKGAKAEGKKDSTAQKKDEAKKKPANDEEDEEDYKPKKAKSELDNLPASPMVLDTIKKLAYSQRPMLPDFFEKLWPQFDAKGYTWFLCDYKYNDENKVLYMTGNTIGGFIQRSDSVRKWSMGVLNVAGHEDEETPPFPITGAWLFRGDKVPAEMYQDNPDAEYYNWVKVDPSNKEQQAKVKEQFLSDKLNGLKVLDRRMFK
jgi:elongation factor 1-gamma